MYVRPMNFNSTHERQSVSEERGCSTRNLYGHTKTQIDNGPIMWAYKEGWLCSLILWAPCTAGPSA